MRKNSIIKSGFIIFIFGIILIFLSWILGYPISLSPINEKTFCHFPFILWPGILASLIGLFIIGFNCKNKIIRAVFSSIIPILLYVPSYFFYYLPSSDSGGVKAMFLVFQNVGLNSDYVSYFEFPIYFTLNSILQNIVNIGPNSIAIISFSIYGILLGCFLYLYYSRIKNDRIKTYPFIMVILYFIGIFSFLNYQWVPQTLALVFLFMILFLTNILIYFNQKNDYMIKFLITIIFISLVFTHPIIPSFFIIIIAFFLFKEKKFSTLFIIVLSIFIIVTIFQATLHFNTYIDTFKSTIFGINKAYQEVASNSISQPIELLNRIISLINRLRVPLIWIIGAIGSLILFFKKREDFPTIIIGLVGTGYLILGMFFSILGLRSLQILLIPIVLGFSYFLNTWKKVTVSLLTVILILTVFSPMSFAYNQTQFQLDEEAKTCNFLADNLKDENNITLLSDQVNYGYFKIRYVYSNVTYVKIIRPANIQSINFLNLNTHNKSLPKDRFIIYNSKLGKEMIKNWINESYFDKNIKLIEQYNNLIYACGGTYILKGKL